MYNVKEKPENQEYSKKYDCIQEKGYFKKDEKESIIDIKSSYIPIENILE